MPRNMVRSFLRHRLLAATLVVAAAFPVPGCTDYDVPGADRPWPNLSDFPERPDAEKMDEQRRRLIGKYGDPVNALRAPAEVPDQPPEGALKVAVIQFSRAGRDLDDNAMDILAQVAGYAQQSRATVWLFGYASRKLELASGGSARLASQALSSDRVNVVAVALVEAGVPAERIQLIARGARDPAYIEAARTGEAGNRRVEIFFTK